MINGRIITTLALAILLLGIISNALAQDDIHPTLTPIAPVITSCKLKRSPTGVIKLVLTGAAFRQESTVRIGGVMPKKLLYKNQTDGTEFFEKVIAKGGVCKGLPGTVTMTYPEGTQSQLFQCNERCSD